MIEYRPINQAVVERFRSDLVTRVKEVSPSHRQQIYPLKPDQTIAQNAREIAQQGYVSHGEDWLPAYNATPASRKKGEILWVWSREMNILSSVLLKGFGRRVEETLPTDFPNVLHLTIDLNNMSGLAAVALLPFSYRKMDLFSSYREPDEVYQLFNLFMLQYGRRVLDVHLREISQKDESSPQSSAMARLHQISRSNEPYRGAHDSRYSNLFASLDPGFIAMTGAIKIIPKVCERYGIEDIPKDPMSGAERAALYLDIATNTDAFFAEGTQMPSEVSKDLGWIWSGIANDCTPEIVDQFQLSLGPRNRVQLDYSDELKRQMWEKAQKLFEMGDGKFRGCGAERVFAEESQDGLLPQPTERARLWRVYLRAAKPIYQFIYAA